ncbi:hypothetical protein CYLTODRAFT_418179 [Cylindrobasidium torrendii FP15055 ss-10]|uniref:Transmembrane protein n=1 Tax=Cylindrobasidium torrendii FP15055 ss-10 TaxID=1314674 RepID=A0A0D7BPS5_9AGAR|nr:hypothetical protein CYLTODRAFT_418179 [Cylindrobasidium torrendii FP15055 ss-10]
MDIEMDDLSKLKRKEEHGSESSEIDDALSSWTWTAASMLFSTSLLLLIAPRVLLFFSESNVAGEERLALTALESFLISHCGVWMFALSVSLVTNLPQSPLPHQLRPQSSTHPLLLPFTVASAVSSLMAYNTSNLGSVTTVTWMGTSVVAIWGGWVLVFGSSGSVSKKTGADKHTSSFLFKNKASASQKKKEWRREHSTD